MARIAKARLLLLPCIFCLALSCAHFLQDQQWWFAAFCGISLIAVLIRQPLSLRINQLVMVLLAAEWIYTLSEKFASQQNLAISWTSLALVILSVVILHMVAALLFQHTALRRYFGFPRTFLFR